MAAKLKKGDKVVVLAGKDKGKRGKVRKVLDDNRVVVSGVNSGQNVGPIAALSGTVGAARTAGRAGYPAVAVSASLPGCSRASW